MGSLGQRGELAAARYLKRQGYVIVARSDRGRLGELDLVAIDKQTVVFVEVKTRRSHEAGHPTESITADKQRRLTRSALAYLKRFDLLREYLSAKETSLSDANRPVEEAGKDPVNERRLTNVGTFRAYVFNYLQAHPELRKDMTLLVRQREPTPDGLPIQIYCFTATTNWSDYEGIQSDIFDHILSVIPQFDLRVYQHPSGKDVQEVASFRQGLGAVREDLGA